MFTKKQLLNLIINKIKRSYFDSNLISEISICAMIVLHRNLDTSSSSVKLVRDLILSALEMSDAPEAIVFTQPLCLPEFSWWYLFIKKYRIPNQNTDVFAKAVVKLCKSSVFKESELPFPFTLTIYQNIFGIDCVKNTRPNLFYKCKKDFETLNSTYLLLDKNALKETLLYYSYFIKTSPRSVQERLITYSGLTDDINIMIYTNAIFGISRRRKLDTKEASLSNLFDLFIENYERS